MATKKMTSKKAEKAEKAEKAAKVEKAVKAEKKAAAAPKKVKAVKAPKSAKPAPADQAYVPAPEVAAILPDLIALRHDLHQHPERGFETAGTRMRVAKWLSDHGVTAIENETLESALFVTVEGNRPGPTIALRADMDALPMTDASGTPYASQTPGCAHTCGHDGHTTWLAGALAALHAKNDFPGRVLGIFQPAEEIGTGAMAVVKAGALQKYGVREIYGMHAEPSVDAGKMGSRWAHAGRRRLLLRDHRREGRARGAPADGGRPHPLRGGIGWGAPDGRDAPHRSDAAGRDFGL